jgi:hypothetical protein
VQGADHFKMRRIPFRYIFPVASFVVAGLLLFVSSWQASHDRERWEDGVGWGEVEFGTPPLVVDYVGAMFLPAAVIAAPVLESGRYLSQVYPIYATEIGIFSVAIAVFAGFLQWYWIGWLLEGQMGYRPASMGFGKRKRIVNSIAIAIAASLAALGAFLAVERGEIQMGIISVLWATACVLGLVRWRRAQGDRSPKTTELSLR